MLAKPQISLSFHYHCHFISLRTLSLFSTIYASSLSAKSIIYPFCFQLLWPFVMSQRAQSHSTGSTFFTLSRCPFKHVPGLTKHQLSQEAVNTGLNIPETFWGLFFFWCDLSCEAASLGVEDEKQKTGQTMWPLSYFGPVLGATMAKCRVMWPREHSCREP